MKVGKLAKSVIPIAPLMLLASMSWAQKANLPSKNPWLADTAYPISHHNPGQTDVSPYAGPVKSQSLTVDDVKTVNAIFASNPTWKNIGDDRIIFISSSNGVIKVLATGEKFEPVSYLPYPTSKFKKLQKTVTPAAMDEMIERVDAARRAYDDEALLALTNTVSDMGLNYTTVANGGYNMVDKDGNHYAVYDGVYVMKSSDDEKVRGPLRVVKTTNITKKLPSEVAKTVTRIMGINITYDGHIVVAAPGMIAVLDRDLNVKDYMTFPGERVENNVAVDEKGIYVASSKNMYKVAWNGKKLSFAEKDGGWVSPYDIMDADKVMALGGLSHGTGTTPTLMGFGDDEDKLVVISDGNENGTNLAAFWREEIPADFKKKPGTKSRRIADQIPVDISYLTIEASPAVLGYGALLLNVTYPEPSEVRGDLFGNSVVSGVTRNAPRGAQKFNWNPDLNKWEKSWTEMSIDNTDFMVPVVSAKTNAVYLANKVGLRYEYIGLDWDSGKIKGRWIMPNDSYRYNGWGGIGYFLDDGDLIYGGFFGVKRVNFK